MDRRNFFRISAAVMAGFGLAKISKAAPLRANDATKKLNTFSLDIITDEPQRAIDEIQNLIPLFNGTPFRYFENKMIGIYTADSTLIFNNSLVDINGNSLFSEKLVSIRRNLDLPKKINDPVLLSLRSLNAPEKADSFSVYRENYILGTYKLQNEYNEIDIDGEKGRMILAVKDSSVKVISSNCKHKTCMNSGYSKASVNNIICIPNRIRISLNGYQGKKVDTIGY
jgi:hypothetical protein